MTQKKRSNTYRLRFAVALLSTISVLLALVIAFMPRGAGEGDQVIDRPEGITDSTDPTATTEEVAIAPITPALPIEPVEAAGDIYLVIDDVGNNLAHLDRFLELGIPITYAILPRLANTGEAARRIIASGYDAILHQPMEAVGGSDPGPGVILTGMTRNEVFAVLESNLEELDGVIGLNNHMGSKVTADTETMSFVMQYLSETDLFFLDSVTTDRSVAGNAASSHGVRFTGRTGVFLDNEDTYDSILTNFRSGVEYAAQTGDVVMIGHVQSVALPLVLSREIPELMARGYTFRSMREYPAFSN